MQAAAVGRVDADRVAAADQPRVSPALGAVAVQDIRAGLARAPRHMALCGDIARADMPAHRHAAQPQREMGSERGEGRIGAFAAGRGIRHDADLVAARGLRARQIEDVTKQPADGRAQDVQDFQGRGPHHVRTSVPRYGRFRPAAPDNSATRRASRSGRSPAREISICCLKARGE